MPKDPTRWIEAPEVKDIADRLIPKYHAHLRSWAEEIRYVFRNEAQVSKGRTVWGKAHKITRLSEDLRAVMRLRGLVALLADLVPQRVGGPQRDPGPARDALTTAGFVGGTTAAPPTFEQMMSTVASRSGSPRSRRCLREVK